jgi:hypothetical protein
MSRLPDFICIGVQKSATTWLYKTLAKHPRIVVPPKKEAHYFDRLIFTESLNFYRAMFDDRGDATKIAGEKTPCYAHLKPRSIAFLREVLPEVKIILFLRRPDERAWSQAKMEVSDYNKRQLTAKDLNRCTFETGLLRNRRRTDYGSILKRWLAAFPREQVYIALHEEIEERPQKVLAEILSFLEVESDWFPDDDYFKRRFWSSPDMEMPSAVKWHLRRKYSRVVREAEKYVPGAAAAWSESEPLPTPSWSERLKTRFLCDWAPIPYNAAYLAYDLWRDARMMLRIRAVRREELTRQQRERAGEGDTLAEAVADSAR